MRWWQFRPTDADFGGVSGEFEMLLEIQVEAEG
jgi:hypothetical protein